jgi:hypothetical protein
MADSWRIHGGGMGGFAKVDDGFGYEKWLPEGSSISLALL